MNINTNPVGNYNLYSIKQMKSSPAARQPVETAAVNQDEKEFFMNMYPEQKTDIADYHFYQKSGKMSGVSLGSLFDRRM